LIRTIGELTADVVVAETQGLDPDVAGEHDAGRYVAARARHPGDVADASPDPSRATRVLQRVASTFGSTAICFS
jgi:hypothetical protein